MYPAGAARWGGSAGDSFGAKGPSRRNSFIKIDFPGVRFISLLSPFALRINVPEFMRDPGVPCQLEFFADTDFAAGRPSADLPGRKKPPTSPTGRLSLPVMPDRVRIVGGLDTVGAGEPADENAKPIESDWRDREKALTELAFILVSRIGLAEIAARISVRWNPRMRTAAGRAFYESFRIELNPALLSLEGIDGEAEAQRTFRHELAHLVAYHRAGGRQIAPHGREWMKACADLGIPDEARCHSLPFEARRVAKKLVYECPECASEIHRVRRFRRAVACYDCCRLHNGGRYDERFRLKARKLSGA